MMRVDVESPGLAVDGAAVTSIETGCEGRDVFAWLELADGRLALWQFQLGAEPGKAQHGPCVVVVS